MNDETMEDSYTGCRYKKPLLDKPLVLPLKKPLLHHPSKAAPHQLKPSLLGVTPERPHLKAPWAGGKRIYTNEETISANSCPTSFPPPVKRQALLPTPGEWSSKADLEQPLAPVTSGLLPRPFRQSQSGLLPPPTCSSPSMYTPPPPCPAPAESSSKASLLPSGLAPSAGLSPTLALLPNPGPRHNESGRGVDLLNTTFKKAPLLQTPLEQGTIFSSKSPLLPLVPSVPGCHSQDPVSKTPLLRAPPSNGMSGHLKHNGGTNHSNVTAHNNGQNCSPRNVREPLIPTPPATATAVVHSNRIEPSTHVYKKQVASIHQTVNMSSSIKRPLLPTPSLLC